MNGLAEEHKENKSKSLAWIIFGGMGFLAIVIIIILAAGIFLWKSIPSIENPIEELETALEEEDTAKLLDLLEPEEEKMNMDEHAMNAFIRYFNEVNEDKEEMFEHLREQEAEKKLGIHEDYFVHLEKNNNGIFTSKYKLVVSPIYFKFQLFYPGAVVNLNNEAVYESVGQEEYSSDRIGPFVPGKYTFVAEYDSPIKTFTAESEVITPLKTRGEQELVRFEFNDMEIVNFYQYNAGLKEYKLFIEGEDTEEVLTIDHHSILFDSESRNLKAYLEGKFPWGNMKSEEIELAEGSNHDVPKFIVEGDIQKEIVEVITAFNENRPKFIASMDKESIASYTTDKAANDLLEQVKQLKEDGQHYRGKFIELEYFPETMSVEKTIDKQFSVLVVARELVKEGSSKEIKPKMEKKHELLMYQLNYDEEKKEWLIVVTGDDKLIKEAFPDIDFDKAESEKYKADKPKTYQSDW